jgi:hypothetical protein
LVLVEEAGIDDHILLHALTYLNPESELPEQVTESVPVDKFNRRGAVPSCFRLSVTSERSRRDQLPFLAPASHSTA